MACSVLLAMMMVCNASSEDLFSLEILHLNDTHSNLLASGLRVSPGLEGERITIPAGSVSRTEMIPSACSVATVFFRSRTTMPTWLNFHS